MKEAICICIFLYAISLTLSHPLEADQSLVVSSTEPPKEKDAGSNDKEEHVATPPKIYEMKVDTNVSNRFATTMINSKVKNLAKKAQETTFSVILPETGYITSFVMEIDGKSYAAKIKEKEEAKQIYQQAIQTGQSAAHVETTARDSNRFTVSINIEPQSKAIFRLTYEELLKRQNSQYEIVININPGQLVKDLAVDVNINETRPLKFVRSPSIRSGNEINKNVDDKLDSQAVINITNNTMANVKFTPDIERQKQLANGLHTKEENGLVGQFVVQYDVERDPQGGQVLVNDGYFVHFFAPDNQPALPKHVVFVLDTSGSMDGNRIQQLKEAMNSILDELKPEDSFNIVEFSSVVKIWSIPKVEVVYQKGEDHFMAWRQQGEPEVPKPKLSEEMPEAYNANQTHIDNAKKVVGKLEAFGGTDIDSALQVGLKLVQKNYNSKKQPLIIFLTDGEATVGETNVDKIIESIRKINGAGQQTPIFSLSFGDGADRAFLEKISLNNIGFARHIYEAADATIQLQDFYKQISSPALKDINFKYVSKVEKKTKIHFPIFFHGSELIVAGYAGEPLRDPVVEGVNYDGPLVLKPQIENAIGSLERLWAYLTVKQILDQRNIADNKTLYTKKALDLSLKYSFVTPVSSLVVVKPNETEKSVETQDASKPVAESYDQGGFYTSKIASYRPVPLSGPPGYSSFGGAGFARGSSFSLMPQQNLLYSAALPARPIAPQYESVEADTLDTQDRISGGAPSTPLIIATTIPTLDITEAQNITDLLPWLNNLSDSQQGYKVNNTVYKLADDLAPVPSNVTCPLTPLNGTAGTCTLLQKCPQVFDKLTDEKVYEKYFCPLSEYLGVCCPI